MDCCVSFEWVVLPLCFNFLLDGVNLHHKLNFHIKFFFFTRILFIFLFFLIVTGSYRCPLYLILLFLNFHNPIFDFLFRILVVHCPLKFFMPLLTKNEVFTNFVEMCLCCFQAFLICSFFTFLGFHHSLDDLQLFLILHKIFNIKSNRMLQLPLLRLISSITRWPNQLSRIIIIRKSWRLRRMRRCIFNSKFCASLSI